MTNQDELTSVIMKLSNKMDDLTDIKVAVVQLTAQISQVMQTQQELTTAIRGNGKPGLVERTLRLETDLEQHKNFCPVLPIVDNLVQDKQRREKKEEEQERDTRGHRWQVYFFGITTIVTTAISIVLFLTNLK